MRLTTLPVLPPLMPYLRKVWVFDSNHDVSLDDIKTVVPSGHLTLTFTYKGDHTTHSPEGFFFQTRSSHLTLIGHQTGPVVLRGGGLVTTVGISFKPHAAHRFFSFPLNDVTNLIIEGDDLFGTAGRVLKNRLMESGRPDVMGRLLQEYLLTQLSPAGIPDPVLNAAVHMIMSRRGIISISELKQYTGYSERHLNRMFTQLVGIPPKTFSRVVRLKAELSVTTHPVREGFYDQAHFIKEFKRFTGYTPRHYSQQRNDFGALFNQYR